MSGNFLSYSKGVKDLSKFKREGLISLKTPHLKWAASRLEVRTSWNFLSCGGCLSSYNGDLRTLSGGLRKGPSHASSWGPLGIAFQSMPGPKTMCGVGAGTLGLLSSADMDLGVLLESQQGSQSSSHVGACTSAFLPSCNSSVTLHIRICGFHSRLFHQPFSQGCPTCLRGWESILGVKVEAVQGKQVPLEWTETFEGLLKWCQDPGFPLVFPVNSASS